MTMRALRFTIYFSLMALSGCLQPSGGKKDSDRVGDDAGAIVQPLSSGQPSPIAAPSLNLASMIQGTQLALKQNDDEQKSEDLIFHGETEWLGFLERFTGERPNFGTIDWGANDVVARVAYFATGGYGVTIGSAVDHLTEVVVTVQMAEPAPGCMTTQALTQPHHFVQIPKRNKAIRFVTVKQQTPC